LVSIQPYKLKERSTEAEDTGSDMRPAHCRRKMFYPHPLPKKDLQWDVQPKQRGQQIFPVVSARTEQAFLEWWLLSPQLLNTSSIVSQIPHLRSEIANLDTWKYLDLTMVDSLDSKYELVCKVPTVPCASP